MTSPATPILTSSANVAPAEIRATVADKVRSVIVDCLGVAAFEVTEGASLAEDLGADSLDMVEIALELESEFGVTLDDETVDQVSIVKDFVEAVTSCLARRAA
ncbi:acyl carrier protein [Jiella pacifica]|uniref:acyl carrier protein n=1 Tax=Jiella pacifica TaxID=2696469 RepID=UPI0028ACDCF9|nr:acyl carrier protein [Jiella pacifica]